MFACVKIPMGTKLCIQIDLALQIINLNNTFKKRDYSISYSENLSKKFHKVIS